jgi:RNA polymerase sigma factor (sigma-70 family)
MNRLRSDAKDNISNYNLIEAVNSAGVSIRQLSEATGIKEPTLYGYLRLRTFPNLENASKIAEYLGKSIDYLFSERLKEITQEVKEERRIAPWKKYRGSLINGVAKGDIDSRVRMRQVNSLNCPLSLDDVADELVANVEVTDQADNCFISELVNKTLNTLTFREREVIKMRYGLNDGRIYTLEEVGNIFRISCERVRQIEVKAFRKLQHPIRAFPLLEAYFPKAS